MSISGIDLFPNHQSGRTTRPETLATISAINKHSIQWTSKHTNDINKCPCEFEQVLLFDINKHGEQLKWFFHFKQDHVQCWATFLYDGQC